jgi:hypothetical protein
LNEDRKRSATKNILDGSCSFDGQRRPLLAERLKDEAASVTIITGFGILSVRNPSSGVLAAEMLDL